MIVAVILIVGLCLGSFVNALVWRLHQQSLPKKKRQATDQELSISRGRSMCPHCKHTLAWYDLVPVLSWTLLGGKCRYCRKSIGWQYPAVELATAGLFVFSYLSWPLELTMLSSQMLFTVWLAAIVGFVALTVYDLKWMLLPNKIVFPLTGLGVLAVVTRLIDSGNIQQTILMSLGGLAVAGGIFYVIFQISDGSWIGGGDVKLGFAIGLLLGSPILAFLMLFVASLLGILAALPAIVLKKSNLSSRMPFGPFLIASTVVVMLFGQHIIDWYAASLLYY